MRPTRANPPMCSLKELQDGTYTLTDVALMNDVLDAEDENLFRAQEISRRKAEAEAKRR